MKKKWKDVSMRLEGREWYVSLVIGTMLEGGTCMKFGKKKDKDSKISKLNGNGFLSKSKNKKNDKQKNSKISNQTEEMLSENHSEIFDTQSTDELKENPDKVQQVIVQKTEQSSKKIGKSLFSKKKEKGKRKEEKKKKEKKKLFQSRKNAANHEGTSKGKVGRMWKIPHIGKRKKGENVVPGNQKQKKFPVTFFSGIMGKLQKKGAKDSAQKGFKRVEKIRWYQGIQMKLYMLVVIPITFLIILGVVSYSKASVGIQNSYVASLTSAAELTTSYYDFVFATLKTDYNSICGDTKILTYVSGGYKKMSSVEAFSLYNEKYTEFNYDITANKFLEDVYLITDDEQSITTSNSTADNLFSILADTEQGKAIVKENNTDYHYFGTIPEVDDAMKAKTEDYAIRIVRKLPKVNSFLVIDLNREEMENIVSELNTSEGSIVAFVTSDGDEVRGYSDEEKELLKAKEKAGEEIPEEPKYFAGQDYYEKVMASEETTSVQQVHVDGKEYTFLMAKVSDTGCAICCLVPQSTIQEQASDIKSMTYILVFISIVISGVLGLMVSQGISRTITSILAQIKKVSQGDLTVQVYTKRKDEFAILATGISDMILHTKNLIEQVELVSTELTNISGEVIQSSEEFLRSSKYIGDSVGEIEVGTNEQAGQSVKCLEEMDHLSKRIEVVSDNTQKINDIATDTNKSIHGGMQSMEALNEKSRSTAKITNVIIESIESLEKQSRSIGKIVGAINDIASETNLLSLNASIEAARAGEAGRGFSVVASEIRKLADQSMASAEEIQKIIEEIVKTTKNAVEIAKEADNIVNEQQEAVDDTTAAFKTMGEQIEVLLKELQGIVQGVEAMEQTRSTTLGAIEEISAVSEETAASASTVSGIVSQQLEGVEELSQNSERLSTSADDLSKAIQQFTIR